MKFILAPSLRRDLQSDLFCSSASQGVNLPFLGIISVLGTEFLFYRCSKFIPCIYFCFDCLLICLRGVREGEQAKDGKQRENGKREVKERERGKRGREGGGEKKKEERGN